MFFLLFFLFVVLLGCGVTSTPPPPKCALNVSSSSTSSSFDEYRLSNIKDPGDVYTLRVIFHVIHDGSIGIPPLSSIERNIDKANEVLAGKAVTRPGVVGVDSKIRLVLSGVSYWDNKEWFNRCFERNISGRIRFTTAKAPAYFVNVWTCNPTEAMGWVNFLPYELAEHSPWNGIFVHYRALPNYTENFGTDYNDGDTFTHEFGHYLGLLHTFGDGFDGCNRGDGVDDTPPEKTAAFGKACRDVPPRKTCPGTEGVDPVFNLMDYTDDTCTEEFTQGQIDLMRFSVREYRPSLLLKNIPACVTSTTKELCQSPCEEGKCTTSRFTTEPCDCPMKLRSCNNPLPYDELWRSIGKGCVHAINQTHLGFARCDISDRWRFNYDWSIVSSKTGWCLTVLDGVPEVGARVGLQPCLARQIPDQYWSSFAVSRAPFIFRQIQQLTLWSKKRQLSMRQWPHLCLQTDFTLGLCQTIANEWVRVGTNVRCSWLKTKKGCLSAKLWFGCNCNWGGARCY